MLTLEEIQSTKINISIIKEGVGQAEKRLSDALETKKSLEQKAFTLLSGYITISIALFGIAANLGKQHPMFYSMIIVGLCFCAGLIFLFNSLRSSDYGTLGRYPDTWLQPRTLDGDEGTLATILGYILHGYQKGIEVSDNSNKHKSTMLNRGVFLGMCAPFVFVLLYVFKCPS